MFTLPFQNEPVGRSKLIIVGEMESLRQDKNYIASVISSVKSSFSGSDIDQELLIKLEQKWVEKLKIIDKEAEKAAG